MALLISSVSPSWRYHGAEVGDFSAGIGYIGAIDHLPKAGAAAVAVVVVLVVVIVMSHECGRSPCLISLSPIYVYA